MCVGVVFVQTLWRLFECDETCGGEHASLTHSSAQDFSPDARLVNKFARTQQHRADGRAQSFRQAEHHGINGTCECGDRLIECRARVEDTRTVKVNRKIEGVRS